MIQAKLKQKCGKSLRLKAETQKLNLTICLSAQKWLKFDLNVLGKVIWISTDDIVRIAREAGTPKEKGAGMVLHAKLGETVHKGDVLFEIYAERSSKLASALELATQLSPVVLTKKPAEKMILDLVPEKLAPQKSFMLRQINRRVPPYYLRPTPHSK